MDPEQPKGFQVRDRRRFTETGEVREDSEETTSERGETAQTERSSPIPPGDAPAKGAATAPAPTPESRSGEPLEITLGTFLVSLSTQALMCLGDIPNPLTGKPEADLAAVRELIDIISMLQEKTRGNVDEDEARLFEKMLYDLRLRYVEKVRK